jgi:hypothetical protein
MPDDKSVLRLDPYETALVTVAVTQYGLMHNAALQYEPTDWIREFHQRQVLVADEVLLQIDDALAAAAEEEEDDV